MSLRIGLVHATPNAIEPMIEAFRRYRPDAVVLNFLDEGLVHGVNQEGRVTPALVRRLARLIETAVSSGVDGVLLTCSAFTPSVDALGGLFEVPIASADRAMLETAVALGTRIAVVATVAAAGPTTADQLRRIAAANSRAVDVEVAMVDGAFTALAAGDAARHDELVAEKVRLVAPAADVVVLAQISMARAAERLGGLKTPVLTSPASGIRAIVEQVTESRKETR